MALPNDSAKVVINADPNARDAFDALFHVVQKPVSEASSWDHKRLPPSFRGSSRNPSNSSMHTDHVHSRQNSTSTDSSSGVHSISPIMLASQQRVPYHERANSSPAIISVNSAQHLSLPKSTAAINISSQMQPSSGPLNSNRNAQINHNRTSSEGAILDQSNDWMSGGNQSLSRDAKWGGHSSVAPAPLRSAVSSDEILSSRRPEAARYPSDYELMPLPKGWEVSYTPAGEKFFINHINKTTTWYDPRIPEDAQRNKILQQHAISNRLSSSGGVMQSEFCQQATGQEQQIANIVCQPYVALSNHQRPFMQQQQQQASQVLPELPVFSETPYCQQNVYQQNPNVQRSMATTFSPSGTQQRVNQLAQEVVSYKIRQREILEQVKRLVNTDLIPALKQRVAGLLPSECPGQIGVDAYNPAIAYQTPLGLGYDTYQHVRQESNDSGFGVNVGYSMPQTPESLSAVDLSTDLQSMDFQPAMEEDIYPTLPTVINDLDQYLNIR